MFCEIRNLGDHLGSTTGLTDASVTLSASNTYDSFGNATNPNFPTRYQFTGRELDRQTGLQFNRARWYDPKIGRFISEDWIGFGGGNINIYNYAGNDSINYRDPSGKIIVPLIIGAVVVGSLILASPTTINAPGPSDRVYYPDNPLILNAAGGAAAGYLFTRFASPVICRLAGGLGEDIIELGIFGGPNAPPVVPRTPGFIATPDGSIFPVPEGAAGPFPTRAPGMQYTGGSGGYGLDPKVTGVRFMDANANQGARAIYMNQSGQTVNPITGRTVPYSDPTAHYYYNP